MVAEQIFQFFLDGVGTIFLTLAGIFVMNTKGISNRFWLMVIFLGLLGISAIGIGGFYDIFDSPAWTTPFSLIILMTYFLIIKFPSSFSMAGTAGIIIIYFLLLPNHVFWANLVGGTVYYLFWVGFFLVTLRSMKEWGKTPSSA
ncbi:MAG: hypothetical protein V1776_00635 [Candidatus Diapherotrites archaeon]